MCGIFGYSGSRPVDITKLRWLAAENQSRGYDSTGVYGNHLYKDKVKAKDFIQSKGFVAAVKGAKSVQGHTRAATVGTVNQANAHPFAYGEGEARCVGAHNGFVIPELIPYYKGEASILPKDFVMEVDSQILFAALAHTQNVDVISRIEGGMAISFMFPNQGKENLYLYKREKTRPLWIGEASDGLYYSSLDDSLKLIGCESIFEITPNTLYTLNRGQIVDMYRLPDPILKSLAANVQRTNWRSEVPVAEIHALPINVGTQVHKSVYKQENGYQNHNQKRLGFSRNWELPSEGDSCALVDDSIRKGISHNYGPAAAKGTDSEATKYKMLIATIQKEIKEMDCEVLTADKCTSRDADDQGGCLLVVRLLNKENSKELIAWSVLSGDDPDISGITSIHGLAVMKVPHKMCGSDMTLHVYDPIDQVGHFKFTIKPEAARVMEVTLGIPFRKAKEKQGKDNLNTGNDKHIEDSCGGGRHEHVIHFLGTNIDRLYELVPGPISGVLRKESKQILGGSQKEQTDGAQATGRPSVKSLPQTNDATVKDFAKLDQVIKKLIPTIEDKAKKQQIIDYIVAVDNKDQYANWAVSSELWLQTTKSEGYVRWRDIYFAYEKQLDIHSLISDAARLQAWDRMTTKWWYKFHEYIECLLIHVPAYYVRNEWWNKNPLYKIEEFRPSSLIKSALETEEEKTKKNLTRDLPYRLYKEFLDWRLSFKISRTMSEKEIKQLQAHSDIQHGIIDGLNNVLQKTEHTQTMSATLLRESVIEARNYLINEKADLDDYISFAHHHTNTIPIS